MKKDYSKICIRTILTYFIIIGVICLLKLVNIDYFGIRYNNEVINRFSDFILAHHLENVWYSITLYIYTYMILSIGCNDKSKKMKIYSLIITAISIPLKFFTSKLVVLRTPIEIIFMLLVVIVYRKNIKKGIKNGLLIIILNCIFQLITSYCKNINVIFLNNFITNIMFDIDYILILLLFYYYYFERKEQTDLWEMVVGFSLDLWHGFTQWLVSSLESLKLHIYGLKKHKSIIKKVLKEKNKTKRIDNIIFLGLYYLLTLFWNVFTIVLIIYIARINNMAITILFVMFAFIFNKGKFGKPLHLKSAFLCFIISNISYYFISRLTLPIGTSYLVPILIGVLTSYYTALIVKVTCKELYRGMSEEDLRELCKIKNMEGYKVDFLVDFYCNKMNYVQLHFKYRYSVDRLRHMKMEYLKEFRSK